MQNRVLLPVSAVVGEAWALAAGHHLWNFWGLPWDKQLLVLLVAGPGLALLVLFILAPIWDELRAVRPARRLLFAVPASLISAALTWQLFAAPETRHQLTIRPAGGIVQISEIRLAYGNSVPLSAFSELDGWTQDDGLLLAMPPSASELRYEFRGPVGEQARISFISSPQGGVALVTLDGRTLDVNLAGDEGNETRARLDTRSSWGALDALFIPLVVAVDWLAFLAALGVLWIAIELGQRNAKPRDDKRAPGWRFHLAGLAAVCSVALVLHALNFLAVPLRVTKDGPSYVEGAAYWAAHGNLDGASSYRGPGTTLLLGPAIMVFGRNPWGVKLVLHGLAFLCVPMAYRIGWQLQRKRWVAIAAGLMAALSPDLQAYSNYVLSEGPDIFALLLFCTALISALQNLSTPWMVISMLAGAMAVLVRTENLIALGVGLCALVVTSLRAPVRDAGISAKTRARPRRAWGLALACAAAITPLAAWSTHNARVHAFFGLSDYGGEILYDGWIYFGESAGIKILDRDSVAVRTIDSVIPIMSRGGTGPPTGWTVYFRLLEAGHTSKEAFSLLGEAAADSITKNPARAARVLLLKLRQAPRPQPTLPTSVSSGGLLDRHSDRTGEFFDTEMGLVPQVGELQDHLYEITYALYEPVAGIWLAYCLLLLWLSAYRRPGRVWIPLAIIASIVFLAPTILGLVSWRYLLPGLSLLTPMALASSDTLLSFGVGWLHRAHQQA